MENTIHSLENLFTISTFRIPQYQRAYSWEQEPHLESFLEDLRQQVSTQKKSPNKHYFLGTFLLHEEEIRPGKRVINIVDGQQRITTAVIFIAVGLALHASKKISFKDEKQAALLRRIFIKDDITELQKFSTIQEDEPFFQSSILGISVATCKLDSPSSRRLKSAADYFTKQVAPDEWDSLIDALKTAKVMIYAVNSAEDATQIFELQNDRGKTLTSLEALKSFLMHCIYLHSPVSAHDRLTALQTQFAKIFRTVESLADVNRTPDEDQLLANHCTAFLEWSAKEYNNPKQLVKATIKTMNGTGVIEWIEKFVGSLLESFQTIIELFAMRDVIPEFTELLLLGRMGSYWPLILKTWRYDQSPEKKDFRKMCRLLEVFTFRGYALSNLRGDTSLYIFQTTARDFIGGFATLFDQLSNMSNLHNLENRFTVALDNADFFNDEGRDALYLLWRYENHLRGQPGQIQPLLSWRDFVEPRSFAAKLSVEHISARGNPIAKTVVDWDGAEPQQFDLVALNRLGNLVIDSISPNSSKGTKCFSGKLTSLSEKSIYLSQGELIQFLKNREDLVWDVEAIRARQKHLIEFARKTWNPRTWHANPLSSPPI